MRQVRGGRAAGERLKWGCGRGGSGVRGRSKREWGSFLCCLWATEGTPGSRRAAGGENSLLGMKFRYCSEYSAVQQLFSCKIKKNKIIKKNIRLKILKKILINN